MTFNRPDHDDFWTLSAIIIDSDEIATKESLRAAIGELVDLDSLAYMAEQRALRSLRIQDEEEFCRNKEAIAILASIWMDAFITGVRFEKKKNSKEQTGIGSPSDPRISNADNNEQK